MSTIPRYVSIPSGPLPHQSHRPKHGSHRTDGTDTLIIRESIPEARSAVLQLRQNYQRRRSSATTSTSQHKHRSLLPLLFRPPDAVSSSTRFPLLPPPPPPSKATAIVTGAALDEVAAEHDMEKGRRGNTSLRSSTNSSSSSSNDSDITEENDEIDSKDDDHDSSDSADSKEYAAPAADLVGTGSPLSSFSSELMEQRQSLYREDVDDDTTSRPSSASVAGHNDALDLGLSLLPIMDSLSKRCSLTHSTLTLSNLESLQKEKKRASTMPLSMILDRILTFCRLQSILCRFPDPASIAHLECGTLLSSKPEALLQFTVYLWRQPKSSCATAAAAVPSASSVSVQSGPPLSNGDAAAETDEIVVEVQRSLGCPIAMQAIRRGLFRALQGHGSSFEVDKIDENGPTSFRRRSSITSQPSSRLIGPLDTAGRMLPHSLATHLAGASNDKKQSHSAPSDETVQTATSSSAATDSSAPTGSVASLQADVTKCLDLLSSPCTDNHRLALQSLCYLTDPHSTNMLNAQVLACSLLLGSPTVCESSDRLTIDSTTSDMLRHALHRIMLSEQSHGDELDHASSSSASSRHDRNNDADAKPLSLNRFDLHCLAMKVVANSLCLVLDVCQQSSKALPPHDSNHCVVVVPPEPRRFMEAWNTCGWFWQGVLDCCKTNLAHAKQLPCISTVSTRVLIGMVQWARLLPLLDTRRATAVDKVGPNDSEGSAPERHGYDAVKSFWIQRLVGPLQCHCFMADLIQASEFGMLDHLSLEQATGALIELLLATTGAGSS